MHITQMFLEFINKEIICIFKSLILAYLDKINKEIYN